MVFFELVALSDLPLSTMIGFRLMSEILIVGTRWRPSEDAESLDELAGDMLGLRGLFFLEDDFSVDLSPL